MPTMAPSGTAEWVEVRSIGKTEWRVSDSRQEVGSTGHVLGFIEQLRRDRYELVWMTEPPRWAYVDSLADAVAAFGDDVDFVGAQLSDREVASRPRRGLKRWVR